MDLTATDAAQLCGLSVRSVNALYQRMRVRLARQCAAQSPFSGELEADESSFGPQRIRGKRGRGAGGKTIVFGLLKQGDRVYIYRDRCRCLQSHTASHYSRQSGSQQHHPHRRLARLRRVGCFGFGQTLSGQSRQQRIRQGLQTHVNGIESFWSHVKHRLAQFHGVRRDKFALHLKESELRFNHRHLDLYKTLLELLRDEPL